MKDVNKLIHNLEKNIKILEIKNNHHKLTKVEEDLKKVSKINVRTMQMFAPYILSAGVLFGVLKFTGNTPFIKDQKKHHATDIIEMDSNGAYSKTTFYNSISSKNSVLFCYTKWELTGDIYVREAKQYIIPNYTEEEVIALINQNIINIEQILGKPISTKYETSNNPPMDNKAFVSALIYIENTDKYYYVTESDDKVNIDTIGYIVLFMLLTPFISKFREKNTSFSYLNSVNAIKLNYQSNEVIEKKLILAKENLELLKR